MYSSMVFNSYVLYVGSYLYLGAMYQVYDSGKVYKTTQFGTTIIWDESVDRPNVGAKCATVIELQGLARHTAH